MGGRLVLVVAIVLLSGCVGVVDDISIPETPQQNPEWTPTPAAQAPPDTPTGDGQSPTETEQESGTTTETDWYDPGATDNPWGQAVVPVRVNDSVEDGRNTTDVVRRAIDYWDRNADEYTDHGYRFRLADDPDNARVEVRFKDQIDRCDEDHAVGCARLIEDDETASDLEIVEVVSRGSNAGVTTTTAHELGHLMGLNHTEEPLYLMAHEYDGAVADASEQSPPWIVRHLSVAIEHEHLEGDRETIEEQVDHVIEYYNSGAEETVPVEMTFDRADPEHTAEIIVTNNASRNCNATDGSYPERRGQNADGDRALELYTRASICVDVHEDATGWHVGYWLGRSLGLDESELATPFHSDSASERRSEWWAE